MSQLKSILPEAFPDANNLGLVLLLQALRAPCFSCTGFITTVIICNGLMSVRSMRAATSSSFLLNP